MARLDANSALNSFKIDKLCEKESENFVYHSKVAAAFKQDCETFLRAFAARKDYNFKAFSDIWQDFVFSGREFLEEIALFAESSFNTLKKFIVFSDNQYIQVGAFYLMYGIYSKQLSKTPVAIRVTLDELQAILSLVEKMEAADVLDFGYIFRELKFGQAFRYVVKPQLYGLEPKFTWQEKKMTNDIFQDVAEDIAAQTLEAVVNDKDNGLKTLQSRWEKYEELLQEFPEIAASSTVKPQEFAERLAAMCKKWGIDVEGFEETGQGSSEETPRMPLKKKAYASPPARGKKPTKRKS